MKKSLIAALPVAATTAFIAGMAVVPNTVYADEVCDITSAATLQTKANAGGEVKLCQDINAETAVQINASGTPLVLDLNGFKIQRDVSEDSKGVMSIQGTVTIKDSSPDGKGQIVLNYTGGAPTTNNKVIAVGDSSAATLIVEGGTYINTTDSGIVAVGTGMTINFNNGRIQSKYGLVDMGTNTNLNITGGEVESTLFAVSGNGDKTHNSNITISGGVLKSSENAAIYNPQTGNLTMTGGTLSGKIGIAARQGTIKVTGGTINATGAGEEITVGDAPGVTFPTGTAVIVDNASEGYSDATEVAISGPVIINADAENPVLAYGVENNEGDAITVGAGVDFTGKKPSSAYLEEDLAVGPNGVVMTKAEAEEMEAELNRPATPTGDETNPDTADSIALYATIAIVALLGLGATALLAKKANR